MKKEFYKAYKEKAKLESSYKDINDNSGNSKLVFRRTSPIERIVLVLFDFVKASVKIIMWIVLMGLISLSVTVLLNAHIRQIVFNLFKTSIFSK